MGIRGMVLGGGQFTVKPVRTDVRRILIADTARVERLVGNRQSKFARLRLRLSNGKSIFTNRRLGLETDELDDDLRRHFAPDKLPAAAAITATVFLTRFARLRLGGVPSAISTTMMLVTNFFMPCRSKSIEVRSLSDSVITPRPYWKCLMYCPSGSAFNGAPKTDAACAKKRGEPAEPGSPLFD